MLFNEKFKLIECTQKERKMIIDLCEKYPLVLVSEKVKVLFLNKNLSWKVKGRRSITTFELVDMSFNAVKAIQNNYKYLKIID